jgi:hypothetical protein
MFVKAINPAERWCSLGRRGRSDLAEFKPVKKWLWNFTSLILNRSIPAVDNFYLNAPAWFGDMACVRQRLPLAGGDGRRGKHVERRTDRRVYKDVDANGDTITLHREFRLNGRQAKIEYGAAAPRCATSEEAVFVHVVARNENYIPGMLGPRGKPWRSCVVSPDKRDFYQERAGYNEMPCHELQWNMRSGRAWATGPGHNALADIRGLDEAARSTIIGIQFEAEPMMWAANEDVMTVADMIPGNTIYGEALQGGKPPIAPIKRGENPQLALAYIQDLRMQVKKAFRFGLTDVLQARPQMTAEEVQGYKADELKLLAPNLTRVYRGVGGFIARRANILGRIPGMIAPPPPELQGQQISPKFVSPFTKAQKAERAQGMLGWVNVKAALMDAGKSDVDG